LKDFLASARKANPSAKILVFGSFITLKAECWELAARSAVHACADPDAFDKSFNFETELAKLSKRYGATYVSLRDIFCPGGSCQLEINGVPFTWDKYHLSYEFSVELGHRLASMLVPWAKATIPKDISSLPTASVQ
jgi:SGNH domain (fused to AT3 domains)